MCDPAYLTLRVFRCGLNVFQSAVLCGTRTHNVTFSHDNTFVHYCGVYKKSHRRPLFVLREKTLSVCQMTTDTGTEYGSAMTWPYFPRP